MTTEHAIHVRGKSYIAYSFIGTVVQSNKQFETVVSGSGGGGASYNGTGSTASVKVSSRTYTHDDIFLVNEHGAEQVIRLIDWDIATREGHLLQVIWLIEANQDEGPYIIINNLTTQTEVWGDKPLRQVIHLEFWRVCVLPLVILACGIWLFGLWLGLIAVIAYAYFCIYQPWQAAIYSAKVQLQAVLKRM